MKIYLSSNDDDNDDMITTMTHDMILLETSRIEETSFTEHQPTVRLRQRQRLLHDYLEDLYRYLDVDSGNVNLVNPDLFKVEKSKSEAVELRFFDGESWVSLTNKRTGKFLAKSTLRNKVWWR